VLALFSSSPLLFSSSPLPGKKYFKKAAQTVHLIHAAYISENYEEAEAHACEFCENYNLSVYFPGVCAIGAESCRRLGKSSSFFTSALSSFDGYGKKEALAAAGAEMAVAFADKTVKKPYIFFDLPGVDEQMQYLLEKNILDEKDCGIINTGAEIKSVLRWEGALMDDFAGTLKSLVPSAPDESPRIYFNGSGNYHHLSFFLVKNIKTPVALVVIDAHTDYRKRYENAFDCGSWVRRAMVLENVTGAHLLGIKIEKEWPYTNNLFRFPVDAEILAAKKNQRVYLGGFKSRFFKDISEVPLIKTRDVYLSIDLDALDENCMITKWGNGSLSAENITDFIAALKQNHRVVGYDICGLTESPDEKSLKTLAFIVKAIKGSGLDIRH